MFSITHYTQLWQGRPYLISAQGEGSNAKFDQSPLYRDDVFDCVTFVNNVLANVFSENVRARESQLLRLNYYDADPLYEKRFHFMSVDWNAQNQKNNVVRDITNKIVDQHNHSIALLSVGEIDKPNWFLKRTTQDIKLKISETEKEKLLIELHALSKCVRKMPVALPYLPLSKLFSDQGLPNEYLFQQIPHKSIIEIVRPNWNLRDKIGTELHVSHVGFAIRDKNQLLFRHASSEAGCVTEILLTEYLKKYLRSETVKGIHVQMVCS